MLSFSSRFRSLVFEDRVSVSDIEWSLFRNTDLSSERESGCTQQEYSDSFIRDSYLDV